jgi:hypothetical protein
MAVFRKSSQDSIPASKSQVDVSTGFNLAVSNFGPPEWILEAKIRQLLFLHSYLFLRAVRYLTLLQ